MSQNGSSVFLLNVHFNRMYIITVFLLYVKLNHIEHTVYFPYHLAMVWSHTEWHCCS